MWSNKIFGAKRCKRMSFSAPCLDGTVLRSLDLMSFSAPCLDLSTTLKNPFLMTFKNKMTIYSFTIRHSFPNLLYVTYLHDVLYVCAISSCFCSPKGTIMKIRSILTCIMLSLPLYLNCKTFRCVYCFL